MQSPDKGGLRYCRSWGDSELGREPPQSKSNLAAWRWPGTMRTLGPHKGAHGPMPPSGQPWPSRGPRAILSAAGARGAPSSGVRG